MPSSSTRKPSSAVVEIDPQDAVALSEPVAWALGELAGAFEEKGLPLRRAAHGREPDEEAQRLIVAGGDAPARAKVEALAGRPLPSAAEALDLSCLPTSPPPTSPPSTLLVFGADVRGLVYAVLELADRVRHSHDIRDALAPTRPLSESPAAKIRSISRPFSCEVEDKPWFHDRQMWTEYLTMLIGNRINRFALTLGMHYNYPYGNEFLNDVYLHFPYPFLLNVPGYDVRADGLPEAEQRKNLETLQFIGKEAARRQLEFQLAIWTQRYNFDVCPDASYQITGVDEHRHGAYCRDALRMLLAAVPEITGLTLRVHVECGVPEGSYDFWRTYFEAIADAGRPIALDLHAKGIDERLIALALDTGMEVTISPKYTLEHQGLPYHQMSIRAEEHPPKTEVDGKWRFSEGSRKFLRYSYGDLLSESRSHGILYRIWPGTQRVLLWGDPALAGGYGRCSSFCGSSGVELCEPLSFKGRMGTGQETGRRLYADPSLETKYDWQKFEHQYRVWGRLLYGPETDPDAWLRSLRTKLSDAAEDIDQALSAASRVCLLFTTAHAPSASNNSWWPEMYENMSLVADTPTLPYGYDLSGPHRYGTVAGSDLQLFASARDFVLAVMEDRDLEKYSPLTVANWLDACAACAEAGLARAESRHDGADPEFRRVAIDIRIQAAIGRFFAAKHRAACAWETFLLTGAGGAAALALSHYRGARAAWEVAAETSRASYLPDLAFGPHSWLRGRWDDRVDKIDADIALMEQSIAAVRTPESAPGSAERVLACLETWPHSQRASGEHAAPESFATGRALELSLALSGDNGDGDGDHRGVRLHYRHVNQAESWLSVETKQLDGRFVGRIPAAYADGAYPIQYYFAVADGAASRLYPGLNDSFSNQPYFVVHPVAAQETRESGDAIGTSDSS